MSCCSALKNFYKSKDVEFRDPQIESGKPNLISFFEGFLKAYKRVIGQKKEIGVMDINEGKAALTVKGYRILNRAFIRFVPEGNSSLGKLSGIFGWACSSASWNNCCRSEMLDRLHAPHFDWVGDGMRLVLVRNKKDQSSTGQGKERMLYANPKDPEVCGILPIALWALCKESDGSNTASEKFFEGDDQKQKYRVLLNKIYDLLDEDPDIDVEILFGNDVEDLGTHSHRKGSVTMLLCIIDGPNPCAVYIRAGWSLGNTQDRYIMGGGGEDELCGRLLAMLNLHDEEFGSLPPHFDEEGLIILKNIGYDRLLKGYAKHKPGYKRCIPYWIALVLFHLPTLKTWWQSDHPVWGALFFQTLYEEKVIDKLRSHIHTGYFQNNMTGLTSTGVPNLVKILYEQQKTNHLLENMPTLIIDTLYDRLSIKIDESRQKQDSKWSSRLVGNDNMTAADVQSMIGNQLGDLTKLVESLATGINQRNDNVQAIQIQDEHLQTIHLRCVHSRTQNSEDDKLYFTPDNFCMPKCDVAKFFRFWHFGKCLPEAMGPFKIMHQDYLHELSKSNRELLCKGASVMRRLESIHFEDDNNHAVAITPQNGEEVRESTLSILIGQLYPAHLPRNWQQLTYTTICKRISNMNPNKRKRLSPTA